MSRASTRTKLPLATWAKIMGIHPLHFEQVRIADQDPHCDQLIFQHNWQNSDHVSREEVAQAILETETRIETYLGYRLAPTWEVDEWKGVVQPYQKEMINYYAGDIRGFNSTVKANWGYMISGGIKSVDLVEADAPIVYTDVDNDGYFETATVVVATVATDKNEICIFYPNKDGDETWEIRPTEVTLSGGNATIVFRREYAVVEELQEVYDITGAEAIGDDDTAFLEEVDVYRIYNDPQTQASFLWEPFAGRWCGTCNGTGCSTCAYATQTGCLLLRGDPRESVVVYHPAEWDSDNNEFDALSWAMTRQPDIVRLYYYSGWRNKKQRYTSRMDPEWERTVAYMAAAALERPLCDCSSGEAQWKRWRTDLALAINDDVRRTFYGHSSDIDNPFGSRLGEVQAWRKVKELAVGKAVVT